MCQNNLRGECKIETNLSILIWKSCVLTNKGCALILQIKCILNKKAKKEIVHFFSKQYISISVLLHYSEECRYLSWRKLGRCWVCMIKNGKRITSASSYTPVSTFPHKMCVNHFDNSRKRTHTKSCSMYSLCVAKVKALQWVIVCVCESVCVCIINKFG